MKIFILGVAIAALALPQTSGITTQQARDCAQNFVGNNNTGTVTCYNVDKKLADQIGQLVSASKRDGRTLKEISDKIDTLLKELRNASPGPNVVSYNQQGGITAAQVTINQGPSRQPPRRIPRDKWDELKAILSHESASVRVSALERDNEAYRFAQDWHELLKDSGWTMLDEQVRIFIPVGPFDPGILVRLYGQPLTQPSQVFDVPYASPAGVIA